MASIIPNENQKEWGWAASANFFLGGTGAGYYLTHVSINYVEPMDGFSASHAGAAVIAAIFMMAGLVCVALEAGRPLQGYGAFRGIGHSWMSREMFCFALFMVFTAGDILAPSLWCKIALAVIATGFIVSQAMVVHTSAAIEPWRSPLLIVMILFNAIVSGIGMVLLVDLKHAPMEYRYVLEPGTVLVVINGLIWTWLVFREKPLSWTRSRRRRMLTMAKIGLGRFLPVSIMGWLIFAPQHVMDIDLDHGTLIFIGLCLLFGSHVFTRWMIQEAGIKCPVSFD